MRPILGVGVGARGRVNDDGGQCSKGTDDNGGGFGGCVVVLLKSGIAAAWIGAFLARHPGTWQV